MRGTVGAIFSTAAGANSRDLHPACRLSTVSRQQAFQQRYGWACQQCPAPVNCESNKQGLLGQGPKAGMPFHTPLHASLRALCAGFSILCRCFHALCAMLVTSHAQTKLLLHSSGPHRRIRRGAIKNAGKLTLAVASDQVSTFTQASPVTQEKVAISVNSLGVGFGTANSRKQVSLL